jgi:hypothetical protein
VIGKIVKERFASIVSLSGLLTTALRRRRRHAVRAGRASSPSRFLPSASNTIKSQWLEVRIPSTGPAWATVKSWASSVEMDHLRSLDDLSLTSAVASLVTELVRRNTNSAPDLRLKCQPSQELEQATAFVAAIDDKAISTL